MGLMLNWPSLVVDPGGAVYAVWQEERGARIDLRAARCGPNCGLPMPARPPGEMPYGSGQDTDPRNAPASHIGMNEPGHPLRLVAGHDGQAGCLELAPLARW